MPGTFSYFGTVGNFNVSLNAGIGSNLNSGRYLTLNQLNVSSATGGDLRVTISDWFNSGNFWIKQGVFGELTKVTALNSANNGTFTFRSSQDSIVMASGIDSVMAGVTQSVNTPLAYVPYRDTSAPFTISLETDIHLNSASNNVTVNGSVQASPVPVPAAAWLFLSALGGMFGIRRSRKN